jgi:hypothetical protein
MFSTAEKIYINHPRGVNFDDRGRLNLSKIFSWYSEDFANDEAELVYYLSMHHTTAAGRLREHTGRVRYNYDWNLNSATH